MIFLRKGPVNIGIILGTKVTNFKVTVSPYFTINLGQNHGLYQIIEQDAFVDFFNIENTKLTASTFGNISVKAGTNIVLVL